MTRQRPIQRTPFLPSRKKIGVWVDQKDGAELQTKSLRIIVHHYVGYPPESWFVTCHDLNVVIRALEDAKTLDDAKVLGLLLVFERAKILKEEIRQVMGEA
jgi:hypothetical protein